MRIKSLLIVFLISCTIFSAQDISAQDISAQDNEEYKPLYYLGVWGSLNLNYHHPNFSELPNIPNCCPLFTEGNGTGFGLGGLFEYPIDDLLAFELRFGLMNFNGMMIEEEYVGNQPVKNTNPPFDIIAADVYVEHEIHANLTAFLLEPSLPISIYEGLTFYPGVKLAYLFITHIDQKETLTRPKNITFIDGRLVRNEGNDLEIVGANSLQIFFVAGLGYALPLGEFARLTPEIRYNLPLTDITSEAEWSVSSLQMGVSLKFPILPPKKLPIIQEKLFVRDTSIVAQFGLERDSLVLNSSKSDLLIEETDEAVYERTVVQEDYTLYTPEHFELRASVEAYGIDRNGNKIENPTIVIEETEVEESFPLLPHIFFERNSSDLITSSIKLLTKEQTGDFSENKLDWNALDIYANLLNIVAYRLISNPGANLTITGCNNNTEDEKGNTELSGFRARSVRDYLINVWDIDPRRLKIDKRNLPENPGKIEDEDGKTENQRVELRSNTMNILKPIQLKEVLRSANPPVIDIYPKIESEAGLKSWGIEVNQKDKNFLSYTSTNAPQKITWNIAEGNFPDKEDAINIELNAADKYEQTTRAEDNLNLKQLTIRKKRFELKDDNRIEKFSLIVFDFNKSTLSREQRMILEEIKDKIQPNSKVTITGYTDRVGEADYNLELAEKRAMEVRTVLGLDDTNSVVVPIGNDILLYDNSTPQGRAYSRTVQIIVKTPTNE